MRVSTIFTVGHSTREFNDVLTMLRRNEVTSLVDVRRFPGSRLSPQWNQSSIIEALPDDIEYRWIQRLGGRRYTSTGVQSENDAWRVKAFRDYADYMASDDFRAGLDELLELATDHRPAIMCSEAVPWRCHRRLIADALIIAGVEVAHIMSATITRAASLSEHACVRNGQITYPSIA